MRKTNARRVGALLVGLALVAAACGDDDDSGSTATTAAASGDDCRQRDDAPARRPPRRPRRPRPPRRRPGRRPRPRAGHDDGRWEPPAARRPRGPQGHDAAGRAVAGLQGPAAGGRPALDRLQLRRRDLRRDHDHRPRRRAGAGRRHRLRRARSTASPATGEKCTDFASCKAIIDAGGDPDYDGFSGPLEFAGNGEPLEASYGLLTFGANNRIDDALTEYFPASAPAEADVPAGPGGRHPRR